MATVVRGDGAVAAGVHTAGVTAGATNFAFTEEDIGGLAECYWKVRSKVSSVAPAIILRGLDETHKVLWGVVCNKDGYLELRDGLNGQDPGWTLTVQISPNTTFRIEGHVLIDGSDVADNELELKLFLNQNGTVADDTVTVLGEYLGAQGGETRYIQHGRINPSHSPAFVVTDSDFDFDASAYIGPGTSSRR